MVVYEPSDREFGNDCCAKIELQGVNDVLDFFSITR